MIECVVFIIPILQFNLYFHSSLSITLTITTITTTIKHISYSTFVSSTYTHRDYLQSNKNNIISYQLSIYLSMVYHWDTTTDDQIGHGMIHFNSSIIDNNYIETIPEWIDDLKNVNIQFIFVDLFHNTAFISDGKVYTYGQGYSWCARSWW